MANECAFASPSSASPLSDGENKENREEAGVTGARSSKNETPWREYCWYCMLYRLLVYSWRLHCLLKGRTGEHIVWRKEAFVHWLWENNVNCSSSVRRKWNILGWRSTWILVKMALIWKKNPWVIGRTRYDCEAYDFPSYTAKGYHHWPLPFYLKFWTPAITGNFFCKLHCGHDVSQRWPINTHTTATVVDGRVHVKRSGVLPTRKAVF